MASYLRPRRGKKATAVAQLTGASCLKRGEVFFEVPNTGVGSGKGAIKMGDGSTDYANLPYFLQPFDPDSASIGFTDASAAESDPYSTNATHAAAITPTANLKTIFTNLKQLLLNYNSQLTSLNNDLVKFSYSGLSNNGIYRGKHLGNIDTSNIDKFLSEHLVSSGTFKDLYLGDIITIKDGTYNADWIIAGFDTEYLKGWKDGDSEHVNKHHISLIPKTILFNARMNSTNTTQGGYYNSEMNKTTLPTVANNLKKALGNHLLNRRVLLSNSISTSAPSMAGAGWTGCSNNWHWYDAYCTLLTEVQCYGSTVLSSSFYDVGEGYEKLPVFNFIHPVRFGRVYFWLRAVADTTNFALVDAVGNANTGNASDSHGVRPLIIIG